MIRTYATPQAFKAALEHRLRDEATSIGSDLQRVRQLFVFDRFLARVFQALGDRVVLKGGLVLEIRLDSDLALLASVRSFGSVALSESIQLTFSHRGTHPVPDKVPTPPGEWETAYTRLAAENGLRWASLEAAYMAVSRFLDPLLAGFAGSWDNDRWSWQNHS